MAVVEGEPFFLILIGLVGGIVLFVLGLRQWKWKRLIENTPTSKIRGIAMGLVEVYGSVFKPLQQFLKSPFTGKDCVYYKFSIEEERGSGKNRHWVTIKSGQDSVPFYAKDNTAAVLVEPKGASVEIPSDVLVTTSVFSQVPKGVQDYCDKSNISIKSWFFGLKKTMRFTEHHLAPNDSVFIMGSAGDNPYVEEATAQKGVEDIMIQKGKNVPFYYISDKTEKEVLKTFAWKVYGGMIGGGALFVISLAFLLGSVGLF